MTTNFQEISSFESKKIEGGRSYADYLAMGAISGAAAGAAAGMPALGLGAIPGAIAGAHAGAIGGTLGYLAENVIKSS
ncbi:Blp family class II bacteriocin [Gracilibacillus lacisalsi]|uniref:Blp family class II bacteriocin n=1 Tax=Gracilibacillus lacisalsi TaxID=393087 RepID=UPI00036586B2|nr:Blp family class II bacteriocin [Gracilibacillus lacisalsi]